jgi:WD40 repeat protein
MMDRIKGLLVQPASVTFLVVSLLGTSTQCGQEPPITDLAFAPDGKSIVACSQNGLQVFSWPELKLQKKSEASAVNNLHCLVFSPDGKQLAVGGGNPSEEGIVEIFSWPDCKSLIKLSNHDDSVVSVVWQGNTKLFSASLDRLLMQWDVEQQKTIKIYQGHSRGVISVCILKDGELVTGGHDQSVRVWNSESGELIRSLNQHTNPINKMALRPFAEGLPMVASAAGDRTIRFWQPTIGRMMRYVRLESEPLDIVWTNDGTRVLAACVDGHVRVIDPVEVTVTQDLPTLDGWAYAIAIHPKDRSVVVGGINGQIRIIELPEVTTASATRVIHTETNR